MKSTYSIRQIEARAKFLLTDCADHKSGIMLKEYARFLRAAKDFPEKARRFDRIAKIIGGDADKELSE